MQHAQLVVALVALARPASAQAQPWPFELDPSVATDPAGVQARLSELGEGVPPIPDGELEATAVAPLTLYFHHAMLEQLELAFASGPGTDEPFAQDPSTCAAHAAFSFEDPVLPGASASCQQRAATLRAAVDDEGESCLRIEFPERYVLDQPPGEAATEDLQTVEGLISIAGEVFTHIPWPAGLLPAGFVEDARRIIAKLRYQHLHDGASARLERYRAAAALLESDDGCFHQARGAALAAALRALEAELVDAQAQLDALYAAGLEQAAQERQALLAMGRQRGELPHPALSDREREQLALYLGGIYWRMRGEALLGYPESGLLRRLLYTQHPFQVIAELTGGSDGAELGRDIFIHENWGYYEWMDIGRNPGNDKFSDLVDMAKRGKRTITLAAPHLQERGYDVAPLYAGALQMGPCYFYAWERLWEPARFFQVGEDLRDPYVWFLESPTAHGEFCTGGALGVGLARALLRGTEGSAADAGSPDAGELDAGVEVERDAGAGGALDGGSGPGEGGSPPTGDDVDGGHDEPRAGLADQEREGRALRCACQGGPRGLPWLSLGLLVVVVPAARRRAPRQHARPDA
ncbi:MAG: hypothetical protein IT383_09705 [Deltaproteobacteria bacterium]|nr:hypothetical protein [Deltaproteobacteria bacterium]